MLVPGSELARVLLELLLQGANWPGSMKAVIHNYRLLSRSLPFNLLLPSLVSLFPVPSSISTISPGRESVGALWAFSLSLWQSPSCHCAISPRYCHSCVKKCPLK